MTKDEIKQKLLERMPESAYAGVNSEEMWKYTCNAFAEALAKDAVAVYGLRTCEHEWSFDENKELANTHSAIAICIEPLKQVDPLVAKLRKQAALYNDERNETKWLLLEAADRIEAQS